jgi:uncharacterized protein
VKITSYKPGMPCWVDVSSPDLDRTNAFYTALFGWTAHVGPPESGGYTIYHSADDLPVAAAGPQMSPDQPPAWMWYAATPDADATARAIEAAGGKTLMAPFDVMDVGRMGAFLDSTGVPFSIWQAKDFVGAQEVNAPGSFTWNELITRDPEHAAEFYRKALGWTSTTSQYAPADGPPYLEFQLDGRTIAGMLTMGDQFPPEVPSYWNIYFAVEDCGATLTKVEELGGSVVSPAFDSPAGRLAFVADPAGAHFAIVKLAPQYAEAG